MCGLQYSSLYNLSRHVSIHLQNVPSKDFSCEACGKLFSSEYSMDRHIVMVHQERSETAKFKCDNCEKSFALKGNLVRHRKGHKSSQNVACPACKMLLGKDNLKCHIKLCIMTKSFKCVHCEEFFSSKILLNEHGKIHKIVTNTYCDHCEKGPYNVKAFKEHMYKYHTSENK